MPRAALGLIKTASMIRTSSSRLNSTDWGFNVGGGVIGFFNDNFGLQGDVRYFRSLQDNEPDDEFDLALGSFNFWRGTVGGVHASKLLPQRDSVPPSERDRASRDDGEPALAPFALLVSSPLSSGFATDCLGTLRLWISFPQRQPTSAIACRPRRDASTAACACA